MKVEELKAEAVAVLTDYITLLVMKNVNIKIIDESREYIQEYIANDTIVQVVY